MAELINVDGDGWCLADTFKNRGSGSYGVDFWVDPPTDLEDIVGWTVDLVCRRGHAFTVPDRFLIREGSTALGRYDAITIPRRFRGRSS